MLDELVLAVAEELVLGEMVLVEAWVLVLDVEVSGKDLETVVEQELVHIQAAVVLVQQVIVEVE